MQRLNKSLVFTCCSRYRRV